MIDLIAVELKNLSVSYGKHDILRNVSLAVQQGEALLIQGPSGCGKSTLLHAICGLIPKSISAEISGEVLISGRNVQELHLAERAKEIGIVFQHPETQLFCDTVEDEIAFGLENLCIPPNQIGHRMDEVLALTGLTEYRFASPKELSGGQKQLVVLAAVLALAPKILIFDEAFSQLDRSARQALMECLLRLQKEGHTLLMVAHERETVPVPCRILNMLSLRPVR